MTTKRAGKGVEIVVVPGAAGRLPAAGHRRKIQQAVRERLLATAREPYHKVQVEVERAPDGSPKALVVSMLRARTYTADVFRLAVDAEYNVTSVEPL